ncbi:MAG: ABC transporter permease [Melioribacteraceae bacterium]|nr:ABC transporter permease [Melioribacteraceae bacterium]
MIELFIARRYLKSKHRVNMITIISILSTLGITIGVAALVIILSVFNGFGSLVTSMMISFDPHIRISTVGNYSDENLNNVVQSINGNNNIIEKIPFVEGKTVVMNKERYEIVNLKGIEKSVTNEWKLNKSIMSGKFELNDDSRIPNIVIGYPIALRLVCKVGDTIVVSSFNNIQRLVTDFSLPKTKRFVVSGIFQTNNKEYDYGYIFTSIKSGQKALGVKNRISGFDIELNEIDNSEAVKSNLSGVIKNNNFDLNTWFDLHSDLYIVMLLERWAAYIMLCLIIAVAAFNILGSLTMSVIEKKKDIGILRSMGTTENSILKIFMFEGLLVGLIGTLAGLILGLMVCFVQIEFNIYALDGAKYIIDTIPLEIRITDIIAISGMSILLSFGASIYPAKKAVKISLIDAIKWE